MHLLVTGGAGFIGSNFIHYILDKYPHYKVINLDCLTYAGNVKNFLSLGENENYQFIQGNITNRDLLDHMINIYKIEMIVNFAAESHVDKSIANSNRFIETNVKGTQILLDIVKKHGIPFIQISTDEVYGSLDSISGFFTEDTPLAPNNPYSASKASADMLVMAYYKTFGLQVNITRCSNNFGPYQYPEKLIPLTIIKALSNEKIPLYGKGEHIRDWIHVLDHCSAIDLVLHKGQPGEVYNIGANNERKNIDIVKEIISLLGKSHELLNFVADRLGHDYRYGIDSSKIREELGWKAEKSFAEELANTVQWYKNNENWWKSLI